MGGEISESMLGRKEGRKKRKEKKEKKKERKKERKKKNTIMKHKVVKQSRGFTRKQN